MKILVLFLLTVCGTCAFAQSFFGVNAGINVANQRQHINWSNGDVNTYFFQNSVRPTFGLFYQYGFNEKLGLRLNVQYMGLGYKNEGANAVYHKVDINYLTLPLTFHYSTNKHLSFSAGPYLSFTLGGTQLGNKPITETYQNNDYGFSLGGEYDLYKNFGISVNYIFGIKSLLI